MGIVFTKYEDEANNNIVFDVSKFDYSYDDDVFRTDAGTDINDALEEIGDYFELIRQTDTLNTLGETTSITEETHRVIAYIQDITKKDRIIQDMGLARKGNRIMYIKKEYPIYSAGEIIENYAVQEGDIFKDRNNNRWRVIKIVKESFINNVEIFKKCVVQSIGLEASE